MAGKRHHRIDPRERAAAKRSHIAACAFVRLAWGERVNVRPMSISEKIETMVANTALGCGPATDDGFLKLLGVPFFEVSRPRDFVRLPEFLDALRELG